MCSPLSEGSHFKIQREQVGTVYAGRSSWLRTKDRISIFKFFVGVGKVEIPKTVNNVPCRAGKGIRVRIIFTQMIDNKVLVVGNDCHS